MVRAYEGFPVTGAVLAKRRPSCPELPTYRAADSASRNTWRFMGSYKWG